MNGFGTVKSWLAELTEIGLLLVALGVVIQILFAVETPPSLAMSLTT